MQQDSTRKTNPEAGKGVTIGTAGKDPQIEIREDQSMASGPVKTATNAEEAGAPPKGAEVGILVEKANGSVILSEEATFRGREGPSLFLNPFSKVGNSP